MRVRRAAAFALLALSVGLTFFNLGSLILPGTELLPDRPDLFTAIVFSLIFFAFPLVGLVIALRRPDHPVGWLLMTTGLMLIVSVFSTEYAGRSYLLNARLPGADLVAWAGGWAWYVVAGIALPLAIALFPSGRFPGPRSAMAFRVLTGAVATIAVASAVTPGDLDGWAGWIRNPFGIGGPIGRAAEAVTSLGTPVLALVAVAAVGTLVFRMRRGHAEERQQLKWLLLPAATFLFGILASSVTFNMEPASTISWTVALVGLATFPVAAAIAILRYRLFDIDVVIRRTLTYALVVALLGVVYVGLVLALQAPLASVTGGGPLPVAVSTLAVAALFGPVRARVRELVERRFYRSRYDAQSTLDRFSAGLRDEVELDAVARSLIGVAGQAVRPSAAGVWIRAR